MPERRRRFRPQFKAEAVQMVLETGRSIAEVAGDLHIIYRGFASDRRGGSLRPPSMINSILAKLSQGPAVMIDRPPPPAAPKSGHRSDRPCHPKVAGQTRVCRSWSGQTQR